MATLSSLREEFRLLIAQTDTSNTNFSPGQIDAWANEGYRLLIAETRDIPITERSYSTPSGSSPTVTLNSNTVSIDKAKIYVRPDNYWKELKVIDVRELVDIDPDWENADVGEPEYLVRMGTFSARLYPPPNTSIESQSASLKTYGLEVPASMSADADYPDVPVILHDAIPHYMAYRAFSYLASNDRAISELRLFRGMVKDMRQLAQKGSDQRVRMSFKHVE